MISAWNVDHGEINKSWQKLRPKVLKARMYKDDKTVKHDTMNAKLRSHALAARATAGGSGGTIRAIKSGKTSPNKKYEDHVMRRAKEHKKGAHGMYAAISRMNRETRTLP